MQGAAQQSSPQVRPEQVRVQNVRPLGFQKSPQAQSPAGSPKRSHPHIVDADAKPFDLPSRRCRCCKGMPPRTEAAAVKVAQALSATPAPPRQSSSPVIRRTTLIGGRVAPAGCFGIHRNGRTNGHGQLPQTALGQRQVFLATCKLQFALQAAPEIFPVVYTDALPPGSSPAHSELHAR